MKSFYKNSILAVCVLALVFTLSHVFAATSVSLGTADSFSVLSGSSIVDSNVSTIVSGDVGLSPGTAFGALTSAEVVGTIYAVNASGPDGALGDNPGLVNGAKVDLTNAFNSITSQPTTGVIVGDLGSLPQQTLTPGVYDDNNAPDSLQITGTLTLDAQGDPDAVFIFKTGSTLTTAAGSTVSLINGAQACNVFWQIGSSATLGTGSTFKGNLMAAVAITDNGGSNVEGRLMASTGAVTLNNTTVTKATCVVPPTPIPTPVATPVPTGGGVVGSSTSVLPLIGVIKVPSPLSLPSGPGGVVYNYTVSNVGVFPMSNIIVKDNECSTVTFVSGDSNNDSMLDVNEQWHYRCAVNLLKTTTNTVTATGQANGFTAIDTANATVVVSVPIIPPLINIVKKPSVFIVPAGGGEVTYTYTVTNPGTAPLSNVSVIDDKCTGLPGRVLGHPGDLNHNDLLESNETWNFTCTSNINQTTTNTGTAEGSANGLTAIDYALSTVVVSLPKLPNTGIHENGKGFPWNVVVPLVLGIATFFYVVRRKQTN